MRRRLLLLVIGIPLLLGLSGLAFAYFTATGAGNGSASTGTLAAPVIASATPGAGTVALSWAPGVTPPGTGTVTYYVTRDGGLPAGTCATSSSPTTATSCTDSGLAAGSHSYTVTAIWQTFSATSTTTNATLASGAAAKLVFTTQPVGGVAESTNFGTSPKVSVEDSSGNVVTSDTGNVTLAINSGPGSGSLTCSNSGFPTIAAVAGVATFTNCQISGTAAAGTYTLIASRSGLTSTPASSNVVITVGSATKLVFTVQPAGGVAEATNFGTSPTVSVEDSSGNVVTGDTGNVTLAINSGPAAGSLTCSNTGFPTIAAVAGVATFTNCQISGTAAAGTYTLVASRSGITSTPASSNVVINVGGATKLVFTTQPVGGVAEATNFGTSPKVSVEDSSGNVVTTDTGNVTLAINTGPGAGSLSCSNTGFPTIAAVAGVAIFTNCQISGTAAAGTYTLVATRTGLTSTGASGNVVINPGTATKLVFTTQPVGGVAEATNFGTSPTVSVEDSLGNVVTTDTGNVTLAINTGPGAGSLTCTNTGFPTIAAVAGVATFTNCQISGTAAAGTYTLVATRTGLTSTGASSNVVITVGSATKLVFTTQPVGGVAESTNFGTSPKVSVEDSSGNVVTTDTGNVTLAINTGPGAGSLSCSNTGFPTIAAVAGVATFTNCQISGTAAAGTYTLVATRTGLTSTGASGNVVINPGTATKLVFTTQPVGGVAEATNFGTSPTVSVEDSLGNVVTTDTGNVTLAINTGPAAGSLTCTNTGFPTIAAVAGVATFTNCQISGTVASGTYTLVATRTGLTSTGASGNVVINPGTATKLVFTTQPVGGVAEATNFGTSPKVSVEDSSGNVVTTDTGNVTLAINTGPGAGSLSCSNTGFPTIAAVAGVATFTNCQISGTAAAGTYTLVATRTGLTSTGASGNVVITVGSATKLVFTTQPVGGVAESTNFGTSPKVSVEDSSGNVVTTDTGNVTLAINTGPGAGSLSCSNTGFPTIAAVAGVATFTNCQISGTAAAGTYTLVATRTGLTSTGASGNVVITVGIATQLVFTTSPSTNQNVASTATSGPYVVQAQDASGNPVVNAGTPDTVSLSTTSPGSGFTPFFTTTMNGTTSGTVTIANGASSTPNFYYSDTNAGTPTITASATVNSHAATGNTTVTMVATAATQVSIGNDPDSTTTSGTTSGTALTNLSLALQLEDQFGNNAVAPSGGLTLGFASNLSGFLATSNGVTGSSSLNVTFAAGVGTSTIYFGDRVAEIPTVTAKKSSTVWGTDPITVSLVPLQQVTFNVNPGGAMITNLSLTLPSAVTSGDALILGVADQSSNGATVASVTETGATWTKAVSTGTSADGDAEIWYALNVPSSASTTVNVTLQFTGGSGSNTNLQYANLTEWTQIATTGALDKTNSGAGTTATISAGTVSPSSNGELLISDAYLLNGNSTQPSASNGYTELLQSSGESGNFRGYGAYFEQPGATSNSTSWTEPGGAGAWSSAIAAFNL